MTTLRPRPEDRASGGFAPAPPPPVEAGRRAGLRPASDGRRLLHALLVPALLILLALPADPADAFGAEVRPPDAAGLRRELAVRPGPAALFLVASWCPPCLRELGALDGLRREYAPRGLALDVISLDYDVAGLARIRELLPADEPLHWVGEGGLTAFGVTELPLVILMRDGREVRRLVGLHTEAELRAALEALLAGPV